MSLNRATRKSSGGTAFPEGPVVVFCRAPGLAEALIRAAALRQAQAIESLAQLRPGARGRIHLELAMAVDFDPEALASMVRLLKQRWPNAKVLAYPLPNEEEALARCIGAGADGIVLVKESLPKIIEAIRDVGAGILRIPPEANRPLFGRLVWLRASGHPRGANRVLACLSTREKEVLAGIRRGESNKQIAIGMGVEVRTVKNHVTGLLRKLGVHNRHDAARVAGKSLADVQDPSRVARA